MDETSKSAILRMNRRIKMTDFRTAIVVYGQLVIVPTSKIHIKDGKTFLEIERCLEYKRVQYFNLLMDVRLVARYIATDDSGVINSFVNRPYPDPNTGLWVTDEKNLYNATQVGEAPFAADWKDSLLEIKDV